MLQKYFKEEPVKSNSDPKVTSTKLSKAICLNWTQTFQKKKGQEKEFEREQNQELERKNEWKKGAAAQEEAGDPPPIILLPQRET